MATLYVEKIPKQLYEALRARARKNRKSISAEVLSLLEQNVVTAAEQKKRQSFLRQVLHLRTRSTRSKGHFPSTELLQREDRAR